MLLVLVLMGMIMVIVMMMTDDNSADQINDIGDGGGKMLR